MTTTAREVAKYAGVSTTTVSRVLNSPEIVSSQTKYKVQEAISELGYTPNLAAASLRRCHHITGESAHYTPSGLGNSNVDTKTASDKAQKLQLLKMENRRLKQFIRKLAADLDRWA